MQEREVTLATSLESVLARPTIGICEASNLTYLFTAQV
jgi:hypothetical protein